MAKLRRQVRRTKEILSANTDAPFSVEELHEGRDFRSSVSRADFEALAEEVGRGFLGGGRGGWGFGVVRGLGETERFLEGCEK